MESVLGIQSGRGHDQTRFWFRCITLSCLLLLRPLQAADDAKETWDVTIHVDASKGKDSSKDKSIDLGTEQHPYATIKKAMEASGDHLAKDESVRILLHPGKYREIVKFNGSGVSSALAIEGTERGKVVVSGAQSLSRGWVVDEKLKGVYSRKWTDDRGSPLVRFVTRAQKDNPPKWLRVVEDDQPGVQLNWDSTEDEGASMHYAVFRRAYTLDKKGDKKMIPQYYTGSKPLEKLSEDEYSTELNSWKKIVQDRRETQYRDMDVLENDADHVYWYEYKVNGLNHLGEQTGYSLTVAVRPWSQMGRKGYQPSIEWKNCAVFSKGEPLRQVTKVEELVPGTYHLDEGALNEPDDGYLRVCFPEGVTPKEAELESSEDSNGVFEFKYIDGGVTLRNLTITKGGDAGVWLFDSHKVHIENCDLILNNHQGLRLDSGGDKGCENIEVKQCAISRNGQGGIGVNWSKDVHFADLSIKDNNRRGAQAGVYGWNRAGIFILNSSKVNMERIFSLDNLTHGVWVEGTCEEITLSDSQMIHNHGYGLLAQSTKGGVTVENCVVARNDQGMSLIPGGGGTLKHCWIGENTHAQLRYLTFKADPKVIEKSSSPWEIHENIFIKNDPAQLLFEGMTQLNLIQTGIHSDRNVWFDGTGESHANFKVIGLLFDLQGWRGVSGQDMSSNAVDPHVAFSSWKEDKIDSKSKELDWTNWKAEGEAQKVTPELLIQGMEKSWDFSAYSGLKDFPDKSWTGLNLLDQAKGEGPINLLLPGLKKIHGVMFQIMRSPQNSILVEPAMADRPLVLTAGGRVNEIYFLHCLSDEDEQKVVGTYRVVYQDKTSEDVVVRSMGNELYSRDEWENWEGRSDIQLVKGEVPGISGEHVRCATIVNPQLALGTEVRNFYTLQWKNPHPEKWIDSIQVIGVKKSTAKLYLMAIAAR